MTSESTTEFVCAVDVGGTFTDSLLVDETGEVTTAKAPSTDDVVTGFFDSIETAATKLDYASDEVFDRMVRVAHGTTVATNMVVEHTGAKTALLTTHGHEDVVRMMKGRGRVTGQPPEKLLNVVGREKPDPIVPHDLIYGIPERIDSTGDVVVDLDEDAVHKATRELVEAGVESIAVSLLWGFKNPSHERRIKEIIEAEAPDVYVSCSHEVSPSLGEYERTVATAINAIVGPGTSAYIEQLDADLETQFDFDNSFLLMKCNGGTAPVEQASNTPIMLIGSGPVGGLRASMQLVDEVDSGDIIATDMGGTSFEVGIIQGGEPIVQEQSVIESYPYDIPKLDIESIGAGGGSIATVDKHSQSLRVGPESAGATPGPACYQRGGQQPTVTDADLLLGYIDPDTKIGEHIMPDRQKAKEAIEPLADELGLGVRQTARGIYDVVNTKMANLIENKVIGRGYDPRTFSIVSYGGAGPIHAASYSREIGANSVVVPGDISPVWSAYGISQSDIRYELERQVIQLEPFDPEPIEDVFKELEENGRDLLRESGIETESMEFSRVAKMRYEGQVHDLDVRLPDGELDAEAINEMMSRFESQYEERYSATARLPEARAEIVTLHSEPVGTVPKFDRWSTETAGDQEPPLSAEKPPRDIYLSEDQPSVSVQVYDGRDLHPGNILEGPIIIDIQNTSVVAHGGQQIEVNNHNGYTIHL